MTSCLELIIIFIEYTNARERKYPTAHDQCHAVLQYVPSTHGQFDIEPNNIMIAGNSVGGAVAVTRLLRAKEDNGPNIKPQLLFYPAVNLVADAINYGSLADGPWISKANLKWAWSQYYTNKDALTNQYVSPFYAIAGQLVGQQRALVITGDCGALHEDEETYAKNRLLQESTSRQYETSLPCTT